jgi:phage-related protein
MEVRFYTTAAGKKPVSAYLKSLDSAERARLADTLYDLQENGLDGSTVIRRQIADKLWEIKVSQQRAFYVMMSGPVMVVLHAYKKEGQRAPRAEIDLALSRMEKVLRAEKE